MNQVRTGGNLQTNSPTTTGKNATAAELQHAQIMIANSNRAEIRPSFRHLLSNYDSVSISSSERAITQIAQPGEDLAMVSKEDLRLTLSQGQQSLTLEITGYETARKAESVAVDLSTVTPPNPKLIKVFGELPKVSLELDEADADILEKAISEAKSQEDTQQSSRSKSWYQFWK